MAARFHLSRVAMHECKTRNTPFVFVFTRVNVVPCVCVLWSRFLGWFQWIFFSHRRDVPPKVLTVKPHIHVAIRACHIHRHRSFHLFNFTSLVSHFDSSWNLYFFFRTHDTEVSREVTKIYDNCRLLFLGIYAIPWLGKWLKSYIFLWSEIFQE